jgi:hypothetical protein
MNRPLIWTGGVKAVGGQIGTLADAHTGVADQQKDVCAATPAGRAASATFPAACSFRSASPPPSPATCYGSKQRLRRRVFRGRDYRAKVGPSTNLYGFPTPGVDPLS